MTSSGKDSEGAPSGAGGSSVVGVLKGMWDRILEGEDTAWRTVSVVALVVLAVCAGVLLGPRGPQVIPYAEDDVGRFAAGTLKAHRSYRIEDHEATEHKRREAREAVPSVYDYQIEARDEIMHRVREAFGFMRTLWREHQESMAAELDLEAGRLIEAGNDQARVAMAGDSLDADSHEGGEELVAHALIGDVRIFREHKDSFLQKLQLPVDDVSFEALVRNRFSSEAEKATIRLVSDGMKLPVIADRQLLAADHMRGMTLRPVPSRPDRVERFVGDVGGEVLDLVAARAASSEHLLEVLEDASPDLRAVIGRMARQLIRPTLYYNRDETERRREQAEAGVRATFIELEAGEKIIGDGERIEPRHLVIFEGIRDHAAASRSKAAHFGGGLLAAIMALSLVVFSRVGTGWRFRPARKDLLFLLTTLLGTLLAVRGGMFLADALADRMPVASGSMLYYAVPAGTAVVLVRLMLSRETTLVFAVLLSVFVGLLADHSLGYALFTLAGGLVAAERAGRARDRGGIWRAGLFMAVVNVVVVGAVSMHEGRELAGMYPAIVSAAAAGAMMPVLVIGLALLVENVFKYTTDLKLLELANMNNPLLKELVVAAPGTYHHSMMIGNMVENAAEAIGANPLLARVGAYYHDIGKGKSPLYFAENQRGENLHDKLAPSMSALVVRRHVTDGIKMARAAGLPGVLIDMIPMHHGTRRLEYFWQKAREESDAKGEVPPAEIDYRYGGPKPRFREAALLMIADSVEAAARSLVDPTTPRLRGLVQKTVNTCFADGQFDECNITLKDLHAITRSLVTSLEAIYHTRPEYHQPADKGGQWSQGSDSTGQEGGETRTAEEASPRDRLRAEVQEKLDDPSDELSHTDVLKRLGTG